MSGLSGTVVLSNNGSDSLTINNNSSFTFANSLVSGSSYSVGIQSQPSTQTCYVANGTGTVSSANVSNVNVTCSTNTYSVGGTISGLASGKTVTLINNGGNSLVASNGSFAFTTLSVSGAAYAVTVATQPTGQVCAIINGTGTVANTNVIDINVLCTNTYTVGGTVTGLTGSVTLSNNGTDIKTINANGSFTFSTSILAGSIYAVTITSQPAGQTCSLTNGSGTISLDVSNVAITCSTNTYTVGGSVSGLTGTVILTNNGGDNKSLSANGSYTFDTQLASGTTYSVVVGGQPLNQTCTVSNGSGTILGSNALNINVNCTTNVTPLTCTAGNGSGTNNVKLYNPANYFAYQLTNNLGYAIDYPTLAWGASYVGYPYLGLYTGSLKAKLWALPYSYSGGTLSGAVIGTFFPSFSGTGAWSSNQIISGGYSLNTIFNTTASLNPPPGQYCMVVSLLMYAPSNCPLSSDGYCIMDWLQFGNPQTFY